jgi:CheY-like chemotaxis protein
MSAQILWLDNDVAYLEPYVEALKDSGYETTVVATVGEATYRINNGVYNLVIIDVMVPTKSVEEELIFKPEETEYGQKTGFIFYKHIQSQLIQHGTKVLIMTVRLDRDILDEFVHAGLQREQFATKFSLRDVNVFLKRIQSVLPVGK